MKKITFTIISVILGTSFFALPVLAATTASFSPANIKAVTGQQFNIAVSVDPQGTKDYVEKIEVDYPADLLEVTSFTLGNGGMALVQPGYDSIDNGNGVLLKTAGYAGGITSSTMFGTILFTAKKAGSGTIAIGDKSTAFQSNGQSIIIGTGSSFTISSATIAPNKPPAAALAPVSSINGRSVATTTQAAAIVNSQVAAARVTSMGGQVSMWMWIILAVLVVIIMILGYLVFKKSKRS